MSSNFEKASTTISGLKIMYLAQQGVATLWNRS
jgi:hypothetical protein